MKAQIEGLFLGVETRTSGEKVYHHARVLVDNSEVVSVDLSPTQIVDLAQYASMSPIVLACNVRAFSGRSGAYLRTTLVEAV